MAAVLERVFGVLVAAGRRPTVCGVAAVPADVADVLAVAPWLELVAGVV